VSGPTPVRLVTSPALRERRLATLLGGRDPRDPALQAAVQDAQVVGSLGLAGIPASVEEVRAARAGQSAAPAVAGMVRALGAVEAGAPVTLAALKAWNAALTGSRGDLRQGERERMDGPPPSPPRFVEGRLHIVEQWLATESGAELKAPQQGALVMARIVEILPFEEANGRVARLAASHLMVRAGVRPPVLVAEDEGRLREALAAAFALHTEPLCALLEEASARAMDVMIRALEPAATP
jgi:hypothetical protein